MARSYINNPTQDLITDSGAVLWSFVKGEQLEFPVTLNFVEDVTAAGYGYEAKIIEALNVVDQTEPPLTAKAGGVETDLVVRVPTNRGTWGAAQAYNKEEVVKYNNVYYKLAKGAARVSATTPDLDPLWVVTSLSKVYIQFPKTLASTWAIQPAATYSTYGFFELRVTEPTESPPLLTRTWKPIRGMVEIMYSPTYGVSGD